MRELGTHITRTTSTPVEIATRALEGLPGGDPYSVAWTVLRQLAADGYHLVGPDGLAVDLYGDPIPGVMGGMGGGPRRGGAPRGRGRGRDGQRPAPDEAPRGGGKHGAA